ncbi:MAG: hypothetical protein ABI354_02380 [Candidatus Saccharimonadales bacterium]
MANPENPRILIATGTLCAGKTTLMSRLVSSRGFLVLGAVTTRAPRDSDFVGEYSYLTDREFDSLNPADMMWNRRHGSPSRYTMLRSVAKIALEDKNNIYTRPLSPHSAVEVANEFGHSTTKVIYLPTPTADVLEKRVIQREQSMDEFTSRIEGELSWDEYAKREPSIYMAEGCSVEDIEAEALALMRLPT